MAHVPDDILMAFVDGELSGEERAWLEGLLAADPVLRRRLEPFAITRAALPIIFDRPMREAVPARLLAVVNASGLRPARTIPAPVRTYSREPVTADKTFFEKLAGFVMPAGPRFGAAAAYATVLAVGVGAGWLAGANLSPGDSADQFVIYERGGLTASGKLQEALNTVQANKVLTVAEADFPSVKPTLSFRSLDGGYCRQYEIAGSETQRFAGYACRADDSTWRIAFHTETLGGGTAQISFNEQPKLTVPPLEAAIDRTIEGEQLTADEEAQAITNGWNASALNSGRN
jgi:hypothetical protein